MMFAIVYYHLNQAYPSNRIPYLRYSSTFISNREIQKHPYASQMWIIGAVLISIPLEFNYGNLFKCHSAAMRNCPV